MKICIAGKNDIACNVLRDLAAAVPLDDLSVICNRDDTGANTWQESLRFVASSMGVQETTLGGVYGQKDLLFVSVEFDRIIKPEKFLTTELYNVHFSALPRHRGVATTIWPILEGDATAGVTFHKIDAGIDTGEIVEQVLFPLSEDFTARKLYFKYMDEGRKLVVSQVKKMLAEGSAPQTYVQDEAQASYHSRTDLDFSNIESYFAPTEVGVSRYLRAFHFFEYQLPAIRGHAIYDFRHTSDSSGKQPGTLDVLDRHNALLYTDQNDVALSLSPYTALFQWASGEGALPDDFAMSEVKDLDLQNKMGWSALMVACYHCNLEAVTALVDAGADINASNKRGTTPLMYSRSGELATGKSDCFEFLLSVGADTTREDVHGHDVGWYLSKDKQSRLQQLIGT